VGVPSSAASYAAGQDLAPAALRSAGLLEQLKAAGLEVRDEGDLPHQIWSPDRDHPLAQNVDQATASLRQLAGDPDVLPPFARSIPRMLAATIH
jgi:arginase